MINVCESLYAMEKNGDKGLAVLIDPEKFDVLQADTFLKTIPASTTHIFVGGSTLKLNSINDLIGCVKQKSSLPVVIFPGSFDQVSAKADAILFLNLVSGRNPEYLIDQQVQAVPLLRDTKLEVIPTGYLLLDGGANSAVARVTNTEPMSQEAVQNIVDTAKAAELMGCKLIYLEAGSGAKYRVKDEIISKVKRVLRVPLIVGGGIRTHAEREKVYRAGADFVVMGTVFEKS